MYGTIYDGGGGRAVQVHTALPPQKPLDCLGLNDDDCPSNQMRRATAMDFQLHRTTLGSPTPLTQVPSCFYTLLMFTCVI